MPPRHHVRRRRSSNPLSTTSKLAARQRKCYINLFIPSAPVIQVAGFRPRSPGATKSPAPAVAPARPLLQRSHCSRRVHPSLSRPPAFESPPVIFIGSVVESRRRSAKSHATKRETAKNSTQTLALTALLSVVSPNTSEVIPAPNDREAARPGPYGYGLDVGNVCGVVGVAIVSPGGSS